MIEVYVFTFKEGLLSPMAHDLKIKVGKLQVDEGPVVKASLSAVADTEIETMLPNDEVTGLSVIGTAVLPRIGPARVTLALRLGLPELKPPTYVETFTSRTSFRADSGLRRSEISGALPVLVKLAVTGPFTVELPNSLSKAPLEADTLIVATVPNCEVTDLSVAARIGGSVGVTIWR